jgi:Pretoxin HINT domain/Pre-toxin TG
MGNEALVSSGAVAQNIASQLENTIIRDTTSNLYSEGSVALLRNRKGQIRRWYNSGFLGWGAGYVQEDTYTPNDNLRDSTYSTADGIVDTTTWDSNKMRLFFATDNAVIPLEAPQTAFSSQVGVDVGALTAPGNSSNPAVDPGNLSKPSETVTPPATSNEPTPAAPAATGGTEVKPQSLGTTVIGGNTINAGTGTDSNPPTTATPAPTTGTGPTTGPTTEPAQPSSSTTGNTIPLEAPSNALPEALQTNGVSSLSAPSSGPQTTLTNPGELTAPGAGVSAPTIGVGANSGASTLTAPGQTTALPSTGTTPSDGSSNLTAPNKGNTKTPGGADGLKSPKGNASNGKGDVRAFGEYARNPFTGKCTYVGYNLFNLKEDCSNDEVGEAKNTWDLERKARNGDVDAQAKLLEKELFEAVDNRYGKDAPEVKKDLHKIKALLDSLGSGHVKLLMLQTLASGMADGKIGRQGLRELGNFAESLVKNGRDAKGNAKLIDRALDTMKFFGMVAGMAFGGDIASMVADMTPGLGDAKGLVEVFTGKDAITNEDLGWMRLTGLLAAVPFVGGVGKNALKGALKGGKLADAFAAASKVLKIGPDVLKNIRSKLFKWGNKCNSFTANTKVATRAGLVAIASLAIGDKVLAYNETTKQDGEYTITQTHKNLDEETTYLTLENPETKKLEYVETTPNHPFYLEKSVDGSTRGKAQGHSDLSSLWVGAGDLKQGDVVKRSSGNVGVVASVQSVTRQQEMYNLTVDEAHTFFVGDGEWVVHNGDVCKTFVNGIERVATEEEELLAKQASQVFSEAGLKGVEYRVTVAVGGPNGSKLLVVDGSAMIKGDAEKKLRETAKKLGMDIIVAPDAAHAEEYIIAASREAASKIGISNPNGPCPACRQFANSNGSSVTWFPK